MGTSDQDVKRQARKLSREVALRIARRTRRPAVALEPLVDVAPNPLGSFLGGERYWSPGGAPVLSANGESLYPLVQVRCDDLGLAGYPREGLLQFFIGTDDLFGCDMTQGFGDGAAEQDGWRVRYIPQTPESVGVGEIVSLPHIGCEGDEMTPFSEDFHGCALSPEQVEQPVSFECDEFEPAYERILEGFAPDEVASAEAALGQGLEQEVIDRLSELGPKAWFQVGGYPSFTQADVRDDYENELVLLKVDSYGDVIMWGDMGVANFLVRRADLERLDFSHVLYTWDCG